MTNLVHNLNNGSGINGHHGNESSCVGEIGHISHPRKGSNPRKESKNKKPNDNNEDNNK